MDDNAIVAEEIVYGGFTLNELNNRVYRDGYNDFKCTYISPNQIKQCHAHNIAVLNFNVRSMNCNFDNFVSEILINYAFDIIGLCETRLTDSSEKAYWLPNYNFFATNVTNNKG